MKDEIVVLEGELLKTAQNELETAKVSAAEDKGNTKSGTSEEYSDQTGVAGFGERA
ncbi:MAG: hypothetical protein IPP22_09455 [Nitrosomonas sp.]|nr:hypothetical protein [Nitrosomonas sp.]